MPVTDRSGRLLGMVGQDHLVEKTGLHTTPGLLAAIAQGAPEAVPEAELFPPVAAGMTAAEVMDSPSARPSAPITCWWTPSGS